jgi:fatty-acid desaturase
MLRSYNVMAYVTVLAYLAAAAFIAPLHGNPVLGAAVGSAYFVFVWFVMGIYLGDVVHLGLAHRSLDVAPWFVTFITVFANLFGVYLNPHSWTNRHRLHHKNADHAGDPNKLASDGFWKTCLLMVFPYPTVADVTPDPIFRTRAVRLVSKLWFGTLCQMTSYAALALVVRDWKFALVCWIGMRGASLYVNVLQNWWTHERRFGTRRYPDDGDNAVNIVHWLPVALSFSACLQNNHHHHPRLVRLSHDDAEPDFGFRTVRWLCRLGLARPTADGAVIPPGVPLTALGL